MLERPGLAFRRPPLESEPDIADAYKSVVEAALRWAWQEVRTRWPTTIRTGQEEEITARMCEVLNEHGPDDARLAPGLSLFETVCRGAKVVTVDERIGKEPDIVLRPPRTPGVRNRGDWGVFVECKIIGPGTNHSPKTYCEKGVERFVRGEYARRMPSAMVLAYAQDGRLPHPTLRPFLDVTYATQSHEAGPRADIAISRHTRSSLPTPCVDIMLTHLWLND